MCLPLCFLFSFVFVFVVCVCHGCNLNLQNNNGETALVIAQKSNNNEILKLFTHLSSDLYLRGENDEESDEENNE